MPPVHPLATSVNITKIVGSRSGARARVQFINQNAIALEAQWCQEHYSAGIQGLSAESQQMLEAGLDFDSNKFVHNITDTDVADGWILSLTDKYSQHLPIFVAAYLRWRKTSNNYFIISAINIYTEMLATIPSHGINIPAEALLLSGYLGATLQLSTLAFSLSTLKRYWRLWLCKLFFSVEAFAKVVVVPGCNGAYWRAQNACLPHGYELKNEPELERQLLLAFNGNNSLSRMAAFGGHKAGDLKTFHSNYFLDLEYVDWFANKVRTTTTTADSPASEELTPSNAITSCTDSWKAAAADAKKCLSTWACLVDQQYDLECIGCKLSTTITFSSLAPRFAASRSRVCIDAFHGYTHNYTCQDKNHLSGICSADTKDFSILKQIFSLSNELAQLIHYSLYCAYIYGLQILNNESTALDQAKHLLGVTNEELTAWRTRQTKAAAENVSAAFIVAVPQQYTFRLSALSSTAPTTSYYSVQKNSKQLATAKKVAAEQHTTMSAEVLALKSKMGVGWRWQLFDSEYTAVAQYFNNQKYHQNCYKAIKNAIKVYNKTALQIREPSLWGKVSNYQFIEEFLLLRNTHQDIHSECWAQPAIHKLMKQSLWLDRVKEEIARLNIKVCQLSISIANKEKELLQLLSKTKRAPLHSAVEQFVDCRHQINSLIMDQIINTNTLDSFSSWSDIGIQVGSESESPFPLSLAGTMLEEVVIWCEHVDVACIHYVGIYTTWEVTIPEVTGRMIQHFRHVETLKDALVFMITKGRIKFISELMYKLSSRQNSQGLHGSAPPYPANDIGHHAQGQAVVDSRKSIAALARIYKHEHMLGGIVRSISTPEEATPDDDGPPPSMLPPAAERYLNDHGYQTAAWWLIVPAFQDLFGPEDFYQYICDCHFAKQEAAYLYNLISGEDIKPDD
ncbi:hypothetical protein CONPUDRAFT_68845 [Coniophora puteana RWD-64-598 SS2]|uniref:CxC1-like cysteine cluster associated with KDZ transposases domain-containing protein n=1 Tax=Coniophora puteana (strain RWD-64-598) TaxID=741705 RepID=A0A5M3N5F5_CONPW|nr:uncharacterized protein CONPUDRAFT_68845 [Coniophora puteana RWD-64-598 SS2]EIW86294.1 hypothetical protein CONPUDRAFT_68845 [Coniophora puteana RWD-64-598 SS2]